MLGLDEAAAFARILRRDEPRGRVRAEGAWMARLVREREQREWLVGVAEPQLRALVELAASECAREVALLERA